MVAVAGINPVVSPPHSMRPLVQTYHCSPFCPALAAGIRCEVALSAPASSAGPSVIRISSSVRSVFSSYGAVLSSGICRVVEFTPKCASRLSFVSSDSAPVPVSVSHSFWTYRPAQRPVSPLLSVQRSPASAWGPRLQLPHNGQGHSGEGQGGQEGRQAALQGSTVGGAVLNISPSFLFLWLPCL